MRNCTVAVRKVPSRTGVVPSQDYVVKIGFANDGCNQLAEHVFGEGGYYSIESRANDDSDGKVDYISTQNKISKTF